jgi:hypothetical protein
MKQPSIWVNHLGYPSWSIKKAIVSSEIKTDEFELQDMNQVEKENLGEYENWKTVFRGKLISESGPMGDFLVGDFSGFHRPGMYRLVLPDLSAHSYQFMISDGVFHELPRLLLHNIHQKRSGKFQNNVRGYSHLDDGVRSDTGEQHDATGGWYDAGDLRKWMTTTNLPVLGFLDCYLKLGNAGRWYVEDGLPTDDWLTESAWAVHFILKMQDQGTGMFFEEIGGGGEARKKTGMSWWYENHSGCLADNSQNHFTDNIPGSGDERLIRVSYNPIVQYVSITILLRFADVARNVLPELAAEALKAARKSWDYVQQQKINDPLHQWTSILSWRLIAGLEAGQQHWVDEEATGALLKELIAAFDQETGFWTMGTHSREPYRGILHSAQPLIALCSFCLQFKENPLTHMALELLQSCREKYLLPMTRTNPFRIMPYGLFLDQLTEKDVYHDFAAGLKMRFFMPDHSPQRINHGLSGHWTSWAHAFSLLTLALGDTELKDLGLCQLNWLLGQNPLNCSVITGVGYNNPMPHSRFLGAMIGGICAGPRGDADDNIFIDLEGRADWSSTEYWNTPTANMLMALAELLPGTVDTAGKIGLTVKL